MHRLLCALLLLAGTARIFGQLHANLVVQQGSANFHSVAFSRDGRQVLTAGDTNAVLWDEATGDQIRVFYGHTDEVNAAAFSPAGTQIVTASNDRTARVWDAATGRELHRFASDAFVTSAAFSPDGKRVLIGDSDGNVVLWELISGKKLLSVRVLDASPALLPMAVAFSPDGQTFVTGSRKTAQLWNAQTGQEVRRFQGHTYPINCVAFSPDGRLLLTGANDYTARLWDVASGQEIREFNDGHHVTIAAVAFSRDGRRAVTGSDPGRVRVWDVASGQLLLTLPKAPAQEPSRKPAAGMTPEQEIQQFLEERRDEAIRKTLDVNQQNSPIAGVAFSPDGKLVASVQSRKSRGNGLWLWNSATGDPVSRRGGNALEFPPQVASLAFSPNAATLWIDGPTAWDLSTGIPEFLGKGIPERIPVDVSHDGSKIAVAMEERVLLFDAVTQQEILEFAAAPESVQAASGFSPMFGGVSQQAPHRSAITSVQFSPDDSRILTIGRDLHQDDDIRLWDVKAGKEMAQCAFDDRSYGPTGMPSPWPHSVVFSPDGSQLLQAGQDKVIRFRNATTCAITSSFDLRDVPAKQGNLNDESIASFNFNSRHDPQAVAFAPGGRQILIGAETGIVGLVNIAPRQTIWTHALGQGNPVTFAVFTPDGSRVVTAADQEIVLLDASTGREVGRTADTLPPLNGLTVSPDGRSIVTSHQDGTIRFWSHVHDQIHGIATLLETSDGGWVVVDPIGRFDTNRLDGDAPLRWVVSDDPMRPLPLEIFMRQYYTPGLLPRLLNGATLPALPGIVGLNRIQPQVKVLSAMPSRENPGRVDLLVHAERTLHGGQNSGLQDLRVFRNGQLVHYLEGSIRDGDYRIDGIQLPQTRTNARFTAYAFSTERIKSPTATFDYHYAPGSITRPRAFLLQIGVNHYQASDCELQYSANDASRLSTVLEERLRARGLDVVAHQLVSTSSQHGATRDDIQKALAAIAAEATPDDVLFLSFSGHGYTSPEGEFYLLPSDIQGSCSRADAGLLRNAISSDELANWLRPIDAGVMTFILDSCYSAESVEANGFRAGPLGSRGLGQLAYDKRMRILVASQSNQTAREDARLGQGILSYVLAEQGLLQGKADWKPKDGKITVAEWLNYAVNEVPRLDLDQIDAFGDSSRQSGRGVTLVGARATTPRQTPALFDFSKEDAFVLQP